MIEVVEIPRREVLVIRSPAGERVIGIARPVVEVVEVVKQGLPGPPGQDAALQVFLAAQALGGHRAVVRTVVGLVYADSRQPDQLHRVVGITTGAASAGSLAPVLMAGEIDEPSWTWLVDLPVFVGADGVLTQVLPSGSVFSQVVGFPVSSTRLFVRLREPVLLT